MEWTKKLDFLSKAFCHFEIRIESKIVAHTPVCPKQSDGHSIKLETANASCGVKGVTKMVLAECSSPRLQKRVLMNRFLATIGFALAFLTGAVPATLAQSKTDQAAFDARLGNARFSFG
jgi:hypothetical protein